jgi:hypothetical protein
VLVKRLFVLRLTVNRNQFGHVDPLFLHDFPGMLFLRPPGKTGHCRSDPGAQDAAKYAAWRKVPAHAFRRLSGLNPGAGFVAYMGKHRLLPE